MAKGVDISGLERKVAAILERLMDPLPALREIGVMMISAMKENFRKQGRNGRWLPSKRAQREGGQTLRDTGTLMNSITAFIEGRTVSAGPTAVGREKLTDPRIMKILAHGGTIKQKNKTMGTIRQITIPARDYTFITGEEWRTFGRIIKDYALKGSL